MLTLDDGSNRFYKNYFLVGVLLHHRVSIWFPGGVVSYLHGEGVE